MEKKVKSEFMKIAFNDITSILLCIIGFTVVYNMNIYKQIIGFMLSYSPVISLFGVVLAIKYFANIKKLVEIYASDYKKRSLESIIITITSVYLVDVISKGEYGSWTSIFTLNLFILGVFFWTNKVVEYSIYVDDINFKNNNCESDNVRNKYKMICNRPMIEVLDNDPDKDQFIDELKNVMIYNDSPGFTVSLNGKWGSGKTTILHKLKNEMPNNYEVIWFNPYNLGNKDVIIENFFELLLSHLDNKSLKLRRNILKYKDLLLSQIDSSTSKIIETVIGKNKDLNELKNLISEELNGTNKKYLIYIDDVDRMDYFEIISVLKLVRECAEFYNIKYIISWDLQNVIDMFKKEKVDITYPDKFYDIDIPSPQMTDSDKEKMITEFILKLKGICTEFDENYDAEGIKVVLKELIHTPREMNILFNGIYLKLVLIEKCIDSINITDIIMMETIKVKDIELWNDIVKKSLAFINSSIIEEENKNLDAIVNGTSGDLRKLVEKVLKPRKSNIMMKSENKYIMGLDNKYIMQTYLTYMDSEQLKSNIEKARIYGEKIKVINRMFLEYQTAEDEKSSVKNIYEKIVCLDQEYQELIDRKMWHMESVDKDKLIELIESLVNEQGQEVKVSNHTSNVYENTQSLYNIIKDYIKEEKIYDEDELVGFINKTDNLCLLEMIYSDLFNEEPNNKIQKVLSQKIKNYINYDTENVVKKNIFDENQPLNGIDFMRKMVSSENKVYMTNYYTEILDNPEVIRRLFMQLFLKHSDISIYGILEDVFSKDQVLKLRDILKESGDVDDGLTDRILAIIGMGNMLNPITKSLASAIPDFSGVAKWASNIQANIQPNIPKLYNNTINIPTIENPMLNELRDIKAMLKNKD